MGKTLVCIDKSNLVYYCNKKGWRFNYKKLKNHLSSLFGQGTFILYDGVMCREHYMYWHSDASQSDYDSYVSNKLFFFRRVEHEGFIVQWKYTSQIFDIESNDYTHKCNFDVEITIDALHHINDYDIFLLLSGDRDFLRLIRYLNGRHKRTVLIYPSGRTAPQLIGSTSWQSIPLGTMRHQVGESLPNK
jgi:uncharacterized LabA/DUF88 family protein